MNTWTQGIFQKSSKFEIEVNLEKLPNIAVKTPIGRLNKSQGGWQHRDSKGVAPKGVWI